MVPRSRQLDGVFAWRLLSGRVCMPRDPIRFAKGLMHTRGVVVVSNWIGRGGSCWRRLLRCRNMFFGNGVTDDIETRTSVPLSV